MITFADSDDDCQQFSVPKNYIAPLMGNFATDFDFYPSFVSYAQSETQILIEWHNVAVKDRKDGN